MSHLSGAVSMGAGVGGLALAAAVAPRAVTSLGLGGDRGLCDNKSGLRRRIVQMLKNVYKICLECCSSLRDVKKRLSCRFEARPMHKEKTFACTAQNDEIWQLFTRTNFPLEQVVNQL